jgi:uncharacterized lipoprotein YmbA
MKASVFAGALLGGTLMLLGTQGCRSPEVSITYHQLHPLAEANPGAHSSLQVEVLPVRLPGMLRRRQMVLPGPTISDTNRWANGLDQDVQRVLVENLARLLGSEAVVAYPNGDVLNGAYRILLDVDQWDGEPAGSMAFRATWILQMAGKRDPICIRKTHLQEPLKDAGPAALVAAHDRILLNLSRELAAELSKQQ